MVNSLDADFPRAVAVLGRMISALETYVQMGAPADELSPIAWASMASKADAEAADAPENNAEKSDETNNLKNTSDPRAGQAAP